MDTATSLLVGLMLSSLGLGYCLYGKKQGNKLAFWCGVVLLGLPYFFDSLLWLSLVALGIMLVPKYVRF